MLGLYLMSHILSLSTPSLSLLLGMYFQLLNFLFAVPRIKPRAPCILSILLFSFHPSKTTSNTLDRLKVQELMRYVVYFVSPFSCPVDPSTALSSLPGWLVPPVVALFCSGRNIWQFLGFSTCSHFLGPLSSVVGSTFGFAFPNSWVPDCTCIPLGGFPLITTCHACSGFCTLGPLGNFQEFSRVFISIQDALSSGSVSRASKTALHGKHLAESLQGV